MRKPGTWLTRLVIALLALLPPLAAVRPVGADSFAWSDVKSVAVGEVDGIISPALDFSSGRTGLWSPSSDLIVEQEGSAVYLSSNTGGFLDVGAVNFSKVVPLSGNYSQRVAAVSGHSYLYMSADGTRVVKFILTQVIPGQGTYGTPTVYLQYAMGSLSPGATLPALGSVDLGKPGDGAGGQPAAPFAWGETGLVTLGDDGGIIAPALTVKTMRTGLDGLDSDVVVEQDATGVYLTSGTGAFLDLGPVAFSQVTPVSGNFTTALPAVAGHTYLFRAGSTVARLQLIQVIRGENQYGTPTVFMRIAAGSIDPTVPLPDAAGASFGTMPAGQPGMSWSGNTLIGLGNVGGIIQPALNLASGRTGLEGLDSDLVISQTGGAVYLGSRRGALMDLGAVTPGKVPPLQGASQRRLPAVPGHVYMYQAGTTVARVQLQQVIPDSQSEGTPRAYLSYAWGSIDPDRSLQAVGSVDLGGSAGIPATPGTWSCLQTVTLGKAGSLIQDALTLATGQAGLASSLADILVEQDLPGVYLKSYTGAFIDLGAVDLSRVPPLAGRAADRVPAVAGHVYLFQSGITMAKLQVLTVFTGPKQHSLPTVTLRWSTTLLAPGAALPDAGSVDLAAQPVQALSDCTPAGGSGPGGTGGTGGSGGSGGTGGTGGSGGTGGGGSGGTGGGGSGGTGAQASSSHSIVFQLNNPVALVDGEKKTMDVAPQLINDRTMVPLRFLGEALGAQVTWDGGERKVTYTLGNLSLVLWVDRTDALVNGQTKSMDVPPTIVGGRVLIPLRFASENLGANVRFDAHSGSVGVATGEAAAAQDTTPPPKESEPTPPPDAPAVPPQPRAPDKPSATVAYAVQEYTRLVRVDLQTGLFSTVFESLGGIYHFRLSPDGSQIAYEDGAGRLLLRSLGDGSERVLYTPLSEAVDVADVSRAGIRRFAAMPWSWSPDGSAVFFLSLGAFYSTPTLYSVPVSGGDATVLATSFDAAWGSTGVVAGDGQSLRLFPDPSLQGGRTLSYADVGGSDGISYMASLSGNGQYLTYVGKSNTAVYVYDVAADSSSLSYNGSGDIAPFTFPRVSNDGTAVLACRQGDLWLVSGDQPRQITDAGDLAFPDW